MTQPNFPARPPRPVPSGARPAQPPFPAAPGAPGPLPPPPPPAAGQQYGHAVFDRVSGRLEAMVGEGVGRPGVPHVVEYESPRGLVRQRLIELAVLVVVGIPGILAFAHLEEADPWGLAVMVVLGSGLLAMLEYPSLGAALRRSHPDALWRAMLVACGFTALAGVIYLVAMLLLADPGEMPQVAQALHTPLGVLALVAWQFVSGCVGFATAMASVLVTTRKDATGQTLYGLLAIPGVILLVGLPMVVLLVPSMLGLVGVLVALAAGAAGAFLLRSAVRAASNRVRHATPQPPRTR